MSNLTENIWAIHSTYQTVINVFTSYSLAANRPPAPIDPICNRHTPLPVTGTEGLLPHSSHTGRIVESDRRSGVVPST